MTIDTAKIKTTQIHNELNDLSKIHHRNLKEQLDIVEGLNRQIRALEKQLEKCNIRLEQSESKRISCEEHLCSVIILCVIAVLLACLIIYFKLGNV